VDSRWTYDSEGVHSWGGTGVWGMRVCGFGCKWLLGENPSVDLCDFRVDLCDFPVVLAKPRNPFPGGV
jgi:hypothetical protein